MTVTQIEPSEFFTALAADDAAQILWCVKYSYTKDGKVHDCETAFGRWRNDEPWQHTLAAVSG